MSNLVAKVEALLLQESFDTLCGASVVYLTIEDNILPPYDKVREIVDRAVNLSLAKLTDLGRRTKVLEILPQVESGYISIRRLKALKVLNMDRELPLDHTQEEIEENLNKLKSKLENAGSMKNILHNKKWKESETDLVKITERILGIITSRSEHSEGTYIADVIIPLLRTSLSDLPNGAICLSTAERQSIASKAQRNLGIIGEQMGKKPDIMGLLEQDEKIIELLYTESSRIVCSNSKKSDDEDQFGIVGIQVVGTTMYLNILVNDLAGIPRYFHLDHAEIPLSLTSHA
ncbi:hypothetical protein RhiirA4_428489 [Rhizophagus irregularis]|uniref:Uncharacterized protein n=1 Tax=Rhizophagus irregularis TaxID=588596 RepID=A0A2I1HD49_9GLOM|nr:hypothetical protein RhiirA4_428489 [Rhizophagus irregularis]